jgi:CRP-like cAMP-binding protein
MINMRSVEPVIGEIIIEEQERGSTMFLVAAGELIVSRDGTEVARCRRGDYFGEVALLFDQPRNATVVADCDVVLYELDRDVFLEAVTGHPRSWQRTNAAADQRSPNFSPER